MTYQNQIMEVQKTLSDHGARFDSIESRFDALDEKLNPLLDGINAGRFATYFIVRLLGFVALAGGVWLTIKQIIH